jgi:hypothetical protein
MFTDNVSDTAYDNQIIIYREMQSVITVIIYTCRCAVVGKVCKFKYERVALFHVKTLFIFGRLRHTYFLCYNTNMTYTYIQNSRDA